VVDHHHVADDLNKNGRSVDDHHRGVDDRNTDDLMLVGQLMVGLNSVDLYLVDLLIGDHHLL
jgi:hypothetical protein